MKISIAKLAKLVEAHQAAAIEYAKFPTDDDARDKLSKAAFAYVSACLFVDDGKDWGGTDEALARWQRLLRSNGCAMAAVSKLVGKKPYQGVFELAGATFVPPMPKKRKAKR